MGREDFGFWIADFGLEEGGPRLLTPKSAIQNPKSSPLPVLPLPELQILRQVELQGRDGDVAVAEGGDVGVVFGVAEGEDAAVPIIRAAAGVLALLVGVGPGADALADHADAGRLLAGTQ